MRSSSVLRKSLPVLAFLGIWQAITACQLFNPLLVPSPISVGQALLEFTRDGGLGRDVLTTVVRMVVGVGLAGVVGIPLGLALGRYRVIDEAVNYPLDFLRSIPATALIPLFLLLFGVGNLSKVLLVAFAVSLVFAVQTSYGVRSASELRVLAARTLGATEAQVMLKVVVPEAMPHIFSALRVGVSLGLILVVVAEMFIGSQQGLGKTIIDAHSVYDIPGMYAAIIVTGLIGLLLNKAVVRFEEVVLHWSGK